MNQSTLAPVLARVIDELDRFPAQPLIALRTLRMIADPDASVAELGQLVEVDPALAARVMRLANSPYYGLSGRVKTPSRAVVLLGFSTVQAVASAATVGLLDGGSTGSDDFWLHSLTVAATSTALARAVHVSAGEAFTVGLLHDLGSSLLDRLEPDGVRRVSDLVLGGRLLPDAEHEVFGTTHAEVGAAALEAWRFPATVVRAVASHHGSADRRTDTLSKLLVAGEALAADIEPDLADVPEELGPSLEALGLSMDQYRRLRADADREIDKVVGFIAEGTS